MRKNKVRNLNELLIETEHTARAINEIIVLGKEKNWTPEEFALAIQILHTQLFDVS